MSIAGELNFLCFYQYKKLDMIRASPIVHLAIKSLVHISTITNSATVFAHAQTPTMTFKRPRILLTYNTIVD